MARAEHISFNGDWHKDCTKCKTPYGAESHEGLTKFFYRNKGRKDGLADKCKLCFPRKKKSYAVEMRKYKTLKARSPEKLIARGKLKHAVKMGRIIKPDKCSKCNETAKMIDGHHTDYAKPLDVIWLCRSCHLAEHGLERRRNFGGEKS